MLHRPKHLTVCFDKIRSQEELRIRRKCYCKSVTTRSLNFSSDILIEYHTIISSGRKSPQNRSCEELVENNGIE